MDNKKIFDANEIKDVSILKAWIVSAVRDAQDWLRKQEESEGLNAARSTTGDYPSWRLNARLSARYFALGRHDNDIVFYALGDFNIENAFEDPMAWFPLIPWVILIDERRPSDIRLVCPEIKFEHIHIPQWSLTLRAHSKAVMEIKNVRRYSLWNGEFTIRGFRANIKEVGKNG